MTASAERTNTCDCCIFWDRVDPRQPTKGLCRRYPPSNSSVLMPQQNALTRDVQMALRINQHVPTTDASEWCGEFKAGARIALSS